MKHVSIDRASAVALAPPGLPGGEAALAHALADELVELTRILADLAYDLGSHPDTLRRHMTSLQSIDLLAQTQLAIADTLRSRVPVADRIAAITLESLSASLCARIGLPVPLEAPDGPAASPDTFF